MLRVPEFKFIREEAKRLGIKVYLFGGTASAFGHYVRWDLLREAGDKRFQKDRFDYDSTNIFWANQSLDIVVDGSQDAIKSLQGILQRKFQHLLGDRSAWEVRSLREDLGTTKMALSNNPNFLNQNSDSNSTGLTEISDSNEQVVLDLLLRFRKKAECFSGTNDSGAFLISETDSKIRDKERIEFLKTFIHLYYQIDPSRYLDDISKAGDLMSSEIWELKRAGFQEVKVKLEANPLSQTARIKSIDLIGENRFEVILELTITQKLSETKTQLRSTVQLGEHTRTDSNPWVFEVVEVRDEIMQ